MIAVRPLTRQAAVFFGKVVKLPLGSRLSFFRLCSRRTGIGILLAAVTIGCSKPDKVETYPVRGQVLVDGKPAEHAFLVFHPTGADERVQKLTPRATTGKDGFYELKTYWSGDGAPRGEYKVTALWRGPLPANSDSEDFNMATYEEQPDKLKGRYDDPAKTQLRMTIQEAGELPALELTTK